MTPRIDNIVIECPDPVALAGFYSELLDMKALRQPPDWMVIGRDDEYPRLAFDAVEDYRPPRWPDPAHPKQVHLDIGVPDPTATRAWLRANGATWHEDGSDAQVWSDPAGHPFCIGHDSKSASTIGAIVLDSEDHATLAAFYAELLGLHQTRHDWDDWWIALDSGDGPVLAFTTIAEHRQPHWPDPAHPQQMHLDISGDNTTTAETAQRLGAARLPDRGGSCPVYADPAGHPFCLCSPGQ
jgi:catechol 2,3-dioxygenase-like lactoylglutathione lyase family enzyme